MGIRPHGAHGLDRQPFVFGIGIAVGKEDRTGKTPLIQQLLRGGLHRVEVHRLTDRAIGKRPFRYFKPQGAIDNGREVPSQPPSARAVTAAHFQHVAQAHRGDHADLGPFAFQQRVGAGSGAMYHDRDSRQIIDPRSDARQKARRLVGARGGNLGDLRAACRLVQNENIGEGAADIDADHAVCAGHWVTSFQSGP